MGWIILILVVLAVIIALAAWWYERATNEVSLLRTGIGGRRVVIDGGVLAIPYFHEIARVNMATLRLDVDRRGEASLITQDRLRVDVGAEFYVSVIPDENAITRAAQTLGKRTFQREELRNLIDGMMVDALRSVAARMTMDELHENRAQFVAEVRDMLRETLTRYGLQLDSVSLTALDQTPFSALDENNAFNAVGMRKLAEVIAKSKKERAEIDADSEVSVRRASMEASRKRLEIDLEERRAEIAQQQEIETLAAAQIAEVAQRKADSERTATEARIQMERSIQAAEVAREQALEIAEQDRKIAISTKSQEQSRAKVAEDTARAEAVVSSEAVETARALAEVRRRAELARVSAESDANIAASRAAIAAESEKATAKDLAAARREAAETEKAVRIAEAEAKRAHIDAENARSEAVIAMELEKARLQAMPKIVGEMVKPAEKIKSINVNHVTGLGGRSADSMPNSPVSTAMDAIMDMAVQMPLLKKIGDQMGVTFDDSFDSGKEKKKD
ncbi:flotillin family protein [Boseongicola aestuarii]|uniref:Inner membrane protein YqiK n=1 Tax=Boseongicola aestuarii TaxID=1470561 RepID=A0A238J014_9RHOB|nr:flotillin domain-containing protein [Boseongicola aestuarii]SMX23976.1 Inner membrane protein YqiK [Boseongicola aestuarii]